MDTVWFLSYIPQELRRPVLSIVTLIVIYVFYKLLNRFIKRTSSQLELEPHVINAFRLLLRVATITWTITVVFNIWELPTEWFIGSSALIGAAMGFGSSQTINNIVAGFYVLVTQPFKVKDYVKIGDLEGQVEEISVNYTSLYTPTFNLLKVPNTQVMNSRILNLTHEGFIKYTFTVGFNHEVSNEVLMYEVIQPAIEEFHEAHKGDHIRKPVVYMEASDRLGRSFLIRFFIHKGEAKNLHILQPELLNTIMRRWDSYRMK